MKKFLTIALVVFAAVALTSCGVSSQIAQTEGVSVSQSNFKYVQRGVSSETKATYVFGIGGLKASASAEAAIAKLKAEHPLGANQAYTNFSVTQKTNVYVVVAIKHFVATADIVEFAQ